jgi:uncharacterized protein involved in response to NO
MIQIQETNDPKAFALLELGFRPFFSAAGLFAVVSVLLWTAMYVFSAPWSPAGLQPAVWHGHEMVFGYAMAVVAGFLLTAVGNWTGVPGLRGGVLAGLVLLWLTARMAWLLPVGIAPGVAAAVDLLFLLGLILGVSFPVFRVRQWQQLGIVFILFLLFVANGVFFAGVVGWLEQGIAWGHFSGLYLILALVLVMARRVVPFFIERGVDEAFSPRNKRWLDLVSLGVFAVWALLDLFTQQVQWVAWLSVILAFLHTWRLHGWHTPGIWRKPLLWSLYLGYGFLVLGFLLKGLAVWVGISPFLALHAFAYGGIGLMTLGMMSRVALGHTGRNVLDPPRILVPVFAVVAVGALIRVLLPILDPADYRLWVASSQVLWMFGFAGFTATYLPFLIRPRTDGRPG